jgi:hypothetical protein
MDRFKVIRYYLRSQPEISPRFWRLQFSHHAAAAKSWNDAAGIPEDDWLWAHRVCLILELMTLSSWWIQICDCMIWVDQVFRYGLKLKHWNSRVTHGTSPKVSFRIPCISHTDHTGVARWKNHNQCPVKSTLELAFGRVSCLKMGVCENRGYDTLW